MMNYYLNCDVYSTDKHFWNSVMQFQSYLRRILEEFQLTGWSSAG